jgi:hypothetical protein
MVLSDNKAAGARLLCVENNGELIIVMFAAVILQQLLWQEIVSILLQTALLQAYVGKAARSNHINDRPDNTSNNSEQQVFQARRIPTHSHCL